MVMNTNCNNQTCIHQLYSPIQPSVTKERPVPEKGDIVTHKSKLKPFMCANHMLWHFRLFTK